MKVSSVLVAAILLASSTFAHAWHHRVPAPVPAPTPAPTPVPVTSPTLKLVANTSATATTAALSNGTLGGATEVSKVNVHSLLYPGNTTKVLVHYLPWFDGADDSGVNVHYSTSDPVYINKFFTDLVSRGVDGVMVDWQGQTDISDAGWIVSVPIIHKYPSLSFAIMLDANLLNTYSGTNQQKVMAAMAYINSHYLSDAQYLTYNGKKVVGDFGLSADSGINWTAVQAAYPNVALIHLDNATSPDGFGITKSGGSFLWVATPTAQDVVPPDLSGIDDFYTRSNLHPSQITIGAAYKGFNSQFAPWDGQIYVDQQCGETWLTSFSKINQYFNSAKQLPFLQLVTWDDYYEGTPLETGINNCLALTATASLRTITVKTTHTDTVDHLELWSYVGGKWTTVSYPATTATIVVPAANTYYIKAVGKPFFKNTLSNPLYIN